jgi:hypothetical protein
MLGSPDDGPSDLDLLHEFMSQMHDIMVQAGQLAANPATAGDVRQLHEQARATEAEFMARYPGLLQHSMFPPGWTG